MFPNAGINWSIKNKLCKYNNSLVLFSSFWRSKVCNHVLHTSWFSSCEPMICFVITPHTGHSWASCLHWLYHSVSPPKEPHNIDLLHICATDPLFTRWHAVQKSHRALLLLSSGQSRSSQLISQQQKQNHFEYIPISPRSLQRDSPQWHEYLLVKELHFFSRTQTCTRDTLRETYTTCSVVHRPASQMPGTHHKGKVCV